MDKMILLTFIAFVTGAVVALVVNLIKAACIARRAGKQIEKSILK